MPRHLALDAAVNVLGAGRSVEQWLGVDRGGGEAHLRWVRLDRERDGTFSATIFEVFDEGLPEFLDVYEFNPVDVDMPYGQARSFPTAAEALAHCVETLGASAQRFVAAGVVQDEYAEYLRSARGG